MYFNVFEDVHLRVKGGHKPPDHGEHVGGIGEQWVRYVVDRAEVEQRVGAGQVAQVHHQEVAGADVVVQPDRPAVVVDGGDCIKILLDPLKIAPLLVFCRVGVPEERERHDSLIVTSVPRVFRARGDVERL